MTSFEERMNGMGTGEGRRIARKAARLPVATKASARKSRELEQLRRWATGGVILTGGLSALLNGYAASQASPVAWAGWAMGAVIPVIVLVLGKVGSLLWRRGWKTGAKGVGGVASGLLGLSVLHCATSIGLLTGSSLWLALPMAVAIDCGLVACEVAALWSHEE
jgi:hypothetical protein